MCTHRKEEARNEHRAIVLNYASLGGKMEILPGAEKQEKKAGELLQQKPEYLQSRQKRLHKKSRAIGPMVRKLCIALASAAAECKAWTRKKKD